MCVALGIANYSPASAEMVQGQSLPEERLQQHQEGPVPLQVEVRQVLYQTDCYMQSVKSGLQAQRFCMECQGLCMGCHRFIG